MAYGDLQALISRTAEVARAEGRQESSDGAAAEVKDPVAAPPPARVRVGGKARVWCEVVCMALAVVALGLMLLDLLRQLR